MPRLSVTSAVFQKLTNQIANINQNRKRSSDNGTGISEHYSNREWEYLYGIARQNESWTDANWPGNAQ